MGLGNVDEMISEIIPILSEIENKPNGGAGTDMKDIFCIDLEHYGDNSSNWILQWTCCFME